MLLFQMSQPLVWLLAYFVCYFRDLSHLRDPNPPPSLFFQVCVTREFKDNYLGWKWSATVQSPHIAERQGNQSCHLWSSTGFFFGGGLVFFWRGDCKTEEDGRSTCALNHKQWQVN